LQIWAQLAPFTMILASLVAFIVGTGVARAQAFHSDGDDGIPKLTRTSVDPGQLVTLYLYYATGSLPTSIGEICHTGDGDELCAVDIGLTSTGTLSFVSFTPDPSQDISSERTSNVFDLNLLDTAAPTLGVHRIGALILQAAPVVCTGTCEVRWERSNKVTASLKLEELSFLPEADDVIVEVPEPEMAWLLLSGIGLLAVFERRRTAKVKT